MPDYILISDAARYIVAIVALWLVAVILTVISRRLMSGTYDWRCLNRPVREPHMFTLLGLAAFLAIAAARRFDRLGQPGDAWLWIATAAVGVTFVGIMINVKFDLRPPSRRR